MTSPTYPVPTTAIFNGEPRPIRWKSSPPPPPPPLTESGNRAALVRPPHASRCRSATARKLIIRCRPRNWFTSIERNHSIVLTRPSRSGIVGSQPSFARARAMSGRRLVGSSGGSGRHQAATSSRSFQDQLRQFEDREFAGLPRLTGVKNRRVHSSSESAPRRDHRDSRTNGSGPRRRKSSAACRACRMKFETTRPSNGCIRAHRC